FGSVGLSGPEPKPAGSARHWGAPHGPVGGHPTGAVPRRAEPSGGLRLELFEPPVEVPLADAEDLRRLVAMPLALLEDALDVAALDFLEGGKAVRVAVLAEG